MKSQNRSILQMVAAGAMTVSEAERLWDIIGINDRGEPRFPPRTIIDGDYAKEIRPFIPMLGIFDAFDRTY